jgi:hypothetical protein
LGLAKALERHSTDAATYELDVRARWEMAHLARLFADVDVARDGIVRRPFAASLPEVAKV